jgi:hypothetical protein
MKMTRSADVPATAVIISYRKNRQNNRLVFGLPDIEIRRGWHRKLAVFSAGQVFGYERWRGDKYGTQAWSLWVCETVDTGAYTQVPGVMPGANLLLHVRGKTKVKRALACLDALREDQNSLENRPAELWCDLHHRLLAGQKETQIIKAITRGFLC